jgi:MFS family permease
MAGGNVTAPPEAPAARWLALALCTLLIGSVSVVWHSFSVFLVALVTEFGWARAEVSLGFSLFVLFSGLTGPNAGQLIVRFGVRPVVLSGGVLLALGLFATSRMTSLWQFYLFFGVVAAVGFSSAGWVPTVTVLQTWFRARLGAATGIASAGVGVGIFLLVPAIQQVITVSGWRTAYLGMAAGTLVLVLPIASLLRPGPLGRTRAAIAGAVDDDPLVVDRAWTARTWTVSAALGTTRYRVLLAGFFLASFASQQVLAHQVAFLRGAGTPALAAATVVGVVGIASIPAKITWGVLSDRIGRELTYTLGVALVVLAVVTLWSVPLIDEAWTPYLYAVLIGGGYAVSATLPPLVVADLFRGAAYAAIFGAVSLASNVGSGAGTWLAGYIFDHTGSYTLAFVIAVAGTVLSAICIWIAAPRAVRRAPGQAGRQSRVQSPESRPRGAGA